MFLSRNVSIFALFLLSINSVAAVTLSSGNIDITSRQGLSQTLTIGSGGNVDISVSSTHNSVAAITLTSGNIDITSSPRPLQTLTTGSGGNVDISVSSTQLVLTNEYRVFIEGNLFLDYSVFSSNQDLFIDSNISIIGGQSVNIFSYDQVPVMPDLSVTEIFKNPDISMDEIGSILIYSDEPITKGIFEATKNVYIGNYLAIKPVPLPASLLLFLSGLVTLIYKAPIIKKGGGAMNYSSENTVLI